MKELDLSSKIGKTDNCTEVINADDVREFIRRLKEGITLMGNRNKMMTGNTKRSVKKVNNIIDNLAGKELI